MLDLHARTKTERLFTSFDDLKNNTEILQCNTEHDV